MPCAASKQDEQDQLDAAAEALRLEEERKAEQERRGSGREGTGALAR